MRNLTIAFLTLTLFGCGDMRGRCGAAGWSGHRACDVTQVYDVENSFRSLQHLLESPQPEGERRVEFDLMTTKDNRVIVMHDNSTGRVSWTRGVRIQETNYADLPKLKDGSRFPLLSEFAEIVSEHQGSTVVEFDVKHISDEGFNQLKAAYDLVTSSGHRAFIRLGTGEHNDSRAAQYCANFTEVRKYLTSEGEQCLYDRVGVCEKWCDENGVYL